MSETTFFQDGGVQVTNARFVVDGQTYAMTNITSVKPSTTPPSRAVPILLLLIGVGVLLAKQWGWGAGITFLSVLWLANQKTTYHVMLHTAGGEAKALATTSKDTIDKVITALNNAIIHRG